MDFDEVYQVRILEGSAAGAVGWTPYLERRASTVYTRCMSREQISSDFDSVKTLFGHRKVNKALVERFTVTAASIEAARRFKILQTEEQWDSIERLERSQQISKIAPDQVSFIIQSGPEFSKVTIWKVASPLTKAGRIPVISGQVTGWVKTDSLYRCLTEYRDQILLPSAKVLEQRFPGWPNFGRTMLGEPRPDYPYEELCSGWLLGYQNSELSQTFWNTSVHL
jgi:hypothetical protein